MRLLMRFHTISNHCGSAGLKEEVYAAQFELACFFQSGDDRWLADHFFEASLNTAKSMAGDNDKKKAEAHR